MKFKTFLSHCTHCIKRNIVKIHTASWKCIRHLYILTAFQSLLPLGSTTKYTPGSGKSGMCIFAKAVLMFLSFPPFHLFSFLLSLFSPSFFIRCPFACPDSVLCSRHWAPSTAPSASHCGFACIANHFSQCEL